MPDTYDHKPTADELLHDLARITDEPESGIVLAPGSTLTGPKERIEAAVEDYKATPDWDATPPTSDYLGGLMHVEHGRWLAVCDELRNLDIDINEHDRLARLMEMWGEDLVALRCSQTSAVRKSAYDSRAANLNLADLDVKQDPSDG